MPTPLEELIEGLSTGENFLPGPNSVFNRNRERPPSNLRLGDPRFTVPPLPATREPFPLVNPPAPRRIVQSHAPRNLSTNLGQITLPPPPIMDTPLNLTPFRRDDTTRESPFVRQTAPGALTPQSIEERTHLDEGYRTFLPPPYHAGQSIGRFIRPPEGEEQNVGDLLFGLGLLGLSGAGVRYSPGAILGRTPPPTIQGPLNLGPRARAATTTPARITNERGLGTFTMPQPANTNATRELLEQNALWKQAERRDRRLNHEFQVIEGGPQAWEQRLIDRQNALTRSLQSLDDELRTRGNTSGLQQRRRLILAQIEDLRVERQTGIFGGNADEQLKYLNNLRRQAGEPDMTREEFLRLRTFYDSEVPPGGGEGFRPPTRQPHLLTETGPITTTRGAGLHPDAIDLLNRGPSTRFAREPPRISGRTGQTLSNEARREIADFIRLFRDPDRPGGPVPIARIPRLLSEQGIDVAESTVQNVARRLSDYQPLGPRTEPNLNTPTTRRVRGDNIIELEDSLRGQGLIPSEIAKRINAQFGESVRASQLVSRTAWWHNRRSRGPERLHHEPPGGPWGQGEMRGLFAPVGGSSAVGSSKLGSAKGQRIGGRPREINDASIAALWDQGLPIAKIAQQLGISHTGAVGAIKRLGIYRSAKSRNRPEEFKHHENFNSAEGILFPGRTPFDRGVRQPAQMLNTINKLRQEGLSVFEIASRTKLTQQQVSEVIGELQRYVNIGPTKPKPPSHRHHESFNSAEGILFPGRTPFDRDIRKNTSPFVRHRDEILGMRKGGSSLGEIAEEFSVDRGSLTRFLRGEGVNKGITSESAKRRQLEPLRLGSAASANRPRTFNPDEAFKLRDSGFTNAYIADTLGTSRTSIDRLFYGRGGKKHHEAFNPTEGVLFPGRTPFDRSANIHTLRRRQQRERQEQRLTSEQAEQPNYRTAVTPNETLDAALITVRNIIKNPVPKELAATKTIQTPSGSRVQIEAPKQPVNAINATAAIKGLGLRLAGRHSTPRTGSTYISFTDPYNPRLPGFNNPTIRVTDPKKAHMSQGLSGHHSGSIGQFFDTGWGMGAGRHPGGVPELVLDSRGRPYAELPVLVNELRRRYRPDLVRTPNRSIPRETIEGQHELPLNAPRALGGQVPDELMSNVHNIILKELNRTGNARGNIDTIRANIRRAHDIILSRKDIEEYINQLRK